MIHWFYLFSNQGSFTLSMAFLESPRKVINTNFKKKGAGQEPSQHCSIYVCLYTPCFLPRLDSNKIYMYWTNDHLTYAFFKKLGIIGGPFWTNRLMQLTNIVWYIMKHRYMWSFSSLDSTLIITEPNSLQITIGTNYGRNGQNRCP